MKNYIKLLWIKYRMRFIGLTIFLLILSTIITNSSLKTKFSGFNEARALTYIQKENPELADEYYSSIRDNEKPSQEEYEKSIKFHNKIIRMTEELNSSKKKITKEDISEIKSSFKKYEKYLEYTGSSYTSFVEQLSYKDKKRNNDILPRNLLEKRNLISEMESKAYTISFKDFEMLILMEILFIIFIAGNITSLESMTRYKHFDESIPLSKSNKYLVKAIFTNINALAIWFIQMLLVTIIYKTSPYSEVFNTGELMVLSLKMGIVFIALSSIFIFIGNYCGNILSYLGSVLFFILSPTIIPASSTSIVAQLFPMFLAEKIIPAILLISDKISSFLPLNLMSGRSFTSTDKLIKFIIISIIITIIGRYISRYIKTERSGMFYNFDIISKIYYAFLTIKSAIFPVNIVSFAILFFNNSFGNIVFKWVIFIIFLLGFGKLYKYLFKAKLSI